MPAHTFAATMIVWMVHFLHMRDEVYARCVAWRMGACRWSVTNGCKWDAVANPRRILRSQPRKQPISESIWEAVLHISVPSATLMPEAGYVPIPMSQHIDVHMQCARRLPAPATLDNVLEDPKKRAGALLHLVRMHAVGTEQPAKESLVPARTQILMSKEASSFHQPLGGRRQASLPSTE